MMRDWFSPPKKPATVLGMIFRFSLVAIGSLGFAYVLVGPLVPFRIAVTITAAVLAPGVTLSIFQQIRLRRGLACEKSS